MAATMLAALACLHAAAGAAQTRPRPTAPQAAKPAEPRPEPELPPPPYEPQLGRLAEIMGALAHLRDLCGHGDGQVWRDKMATLLQAEAAAKSRKETLAGAYNRGFRGFAHTYRTCTPAARLVIERYGAEGATITRDIARRYGG